VLAGQLKKRFYELIDEPQDAELVVVNTCGFIEDAKKESIQAIFEALNLKQKDKNKRVYITGCLSQRYKNELLAEIPEVDGIFGTEDYQNILTNLGEDQFRPEELYQMRTLSASSHFTYIKISEGCNHTCAFCAIPGIRGNHRSRSFNDIIYEAKMLAEKGVRELILVSQDTSYYGKDRYGTQRIVELLEEIAKTGLFEWIRPLYWYPTNFPLQFIDLMNKYKCILPYLDMPIQHASDSVLGYMRRAENQKSLRDLYKEIRAIRSDVCLRTTLILGHPGESEDDFKQLKEFIQDIRFDRLGTFIYSDEEGTPAYNYQEKVPREVAIERRDEIMTIQQSISREKNNQLINSIEKVLIDDYDPSQKCYNGRTYRDAPEIDNEVLVYGNNEREIIGTFQNVQILDAAEYELYGKLSVC
jgi:ribosomal protein S12 methylthiotransferase